MMTLSAWSPALLFAAKTPPKAPAVDHQVHSLIQSVIKLLGVPAGYEPMAEWALRFGAAFVIFIFFTGFARRSRIRSIVDWLDNKIGVIQLTPADRSFFSFLAWAFLWVPGVFLILFVLKLTGLFATLGISAGAVAAIAATANRELIGNVSSGFALQARRQISKGDSVKVKDISGTLTAIGLTSSSIEDVNGVVHFIPNSKLLNEVLTNYSLATFRRAEIAFYFDVDEVDIGEVEDILREVIAEAEGQKADKPGLFRYGALSDRGQEVTLYLYFEVDNWGECESQARRLLLEKIEDSEVQIGVPQQLVLQVEDDEESA